MNPGEIFLANFPFGGSAGMKLRPVLLLTGAIGSVPEVLVAYISSVIPAALLPADVILDPADSRYATTKPKIKSVLARLLAGAELSTQFACVLTSLSTPPPSQVSVAARAASGASKSEAMPRVRRRGVFIG